MNYTFNEGDNVTITAEFIDYLEDLEKENQQLKERIEYLERSNNRREDTIISLRDELVGRETVLDEIREKIEFAKITIEYGRDCSGVGYNFLISADKIVEILDKVKE